MYGQLCSTKHKHWTRNLLRGSQNLWRQAGKEIKFSGLSLKISVFSSEHLKKVAFLNPCTCFCYNKSLFIYLFIYTTTHCSLLRLIVRSGLDVPNSATAREHSAAEGGTVNEKCPVKFCLNVDLHVTFRDLLHAVKLRHGTDGFTYPPKEDVLRICSP